VTVLQPIEPRNLADAVVDRLLAYVKDARLRPGDPLPGEHDLAGQLGVSRNVVREAISRLRVLGIVETRKYRGAILCEADPLAGVERILDTPLVTSETECELLEMRVAIEMGVVHMFWMRKTDADVADLEALAEEIESSHPLSNARRNAEAAFHGRILDVVGNNMLSRLVGLLRKAFEIEAPLHEALGQYKAADCPDHRAVVAAIKSGSVDQFRETLWNHMRVYIDAMNVERQRRAGAES